MSFKYARPIMKLLKSPRVMSVRTLITPSAGSTSHKIQVLSEALEEVQRHTSVFGESREFLTSILPPSQNFLPPRTMEDSLTYAIIPIGSIPEVRLKYTSHIGGARLGRLLQDMDHFAGIVVYKHISNPLQLPAGLSAHAVVTARMDHLYIRENIKNDADIVLAGHVTWVGTSKAEVGIRMEQMEETGKLKTVCEARFVMVARDAATGMNAAPINPLIVETQEEKALNKLAEMNIAARTRADQDSLFKEPPSKVENDLIHNMFLSTVDHKARSFAARIKPENSAWMGDSKLKSIMLCEPEHKNDYNKIFGGLIMERCMDLAFFNTFVYTGSAEVPVCTHIDDVVFLKALEIGDLVYLHSQVVFTLGNHVQTRVSAEVLDRETKRLKLTNVLQVTFQLPSKVPHVVPKSYHEAMAYLTGRRHFLVSLEREGVLDKTGVEHELQKNAKYAPMWTTEKFVSEVDDCKKNIVSDAVDEEDMFLGAEMTKEIRDRENGILY